MKNIECIAKVAHLSTEEVKTVKLNKLGYMLAFQLNIFNQRQSI